MRYSIFRGLGKIRIYFVVKGGIFCINMNNYVNLVIDII